MAGDSEERGFNAETIRKDDDYDLGGGVKGRFVAPSMPELRKFRERVLNVGSDVEGFDEIEADDGAGADSLLALAQRVNKLPRGQADALLDDVRDAVIDVCNGHPSRDEILALEGPIQQFFVNWILGKLSPLF
jgi:hypothetical protein